MCALFLGGGGSKIGKVCFGGIGWGGDWMEAEGGVGVGEGDGVGTLGGGFSGEGKREGEREGE